MNFNEYYSRMKEQQSSKLMTYQEVDLFQCYSKQRLYSSSLELLPVNG